MFKLGVINDEVSQDFATVVNFVKEFNLHSIEIRIGLGQTSPMNSLITTSMR